MEETGLQFRSKAGDNQQRMARRQRKYTSKACNECRRRRAKCDGASPRCSRCTNRGINCQYRTEEDRRRPAPRSYVEMLRGRIDLLERVLQINSIDIDASIAVLTEKERSRKPSREPEDSPPSSINDAQQPPSDGTNTSLIILKEPAESFSGMLSSDKALNFERDGEIRYFGPTSGRLNFGSPDIKDPLESFTNSTSAHRLAENTTSGIKLSDTSRSTAADLSHVRAQVNKSFSTDDNDAISEQLKLHLIDLYFEWYQPWCQMVDERLFRESRASHGRYHSPLLEHCILAIGARFSDLPELRSDPTDPNTARNLLFDKAEVLLYYDLKWPTITTIQSLSLLSILHVAVGADAAGWLRQGMAIRLALDMGLNFDAAALRGSNMLTSEEIELRRQIYWALYCDDKLYAIYTGRVCTMLSCQASVQLPSVHSDHSGCSVSLTTDHTINMLHQIALIRLTKILEKVLMSLYTPKPSMGQVERAAFFDSSMLDLKTWYYDLPPDLRIHRTTRATPDRPSAVYILHMLYHTTHILLSKAFLTGNRDLGGDPIPDRQETEQNLPDNNESILKKAGSCVHLAARKICAIARMYREAFGSFRRCPTTATHCTLSATLALLQPTKAAGTGKTGSTSTIQPDIDLCLNVLCELSVSWSTAGKLRAGLKQLVDSQQKNRKSIQKDGDANTDPQLEDSRSWEPRAPQTIEPDGDLYGFDAVVVDNWDIGQTDPWWFGQEFDLFGSLPIDYQAFDSLSSLTYDESWS